MQMKRAFFALSLLALTARSSGAAVPAQPPAPKPLALRPCAAVPGLPAGARCGTYEVFENRSARTGRKIPLRVVVLSALGPERAPDAIVYFAGGPGGSSVEEGVELGQVLQQLHQRRDILLVDMRGTGGSAALVCPELQGSQGVQGFLDDFMPTAKVAACRERWRRSADLTQYTTDSAVDDVDEVRAALGYPQVDVIGGSYGTRAVLVYLRRHPERVRTAMLEGVVPTSDRSPLYFARSVQKALDGLSAECAADPACAAAFPKLKEEIAAVLGRVAREPVRVELPDPGTGQPTEIRLSRNAVAQTLRYMLYVPAAAVQIPLEVHLAAQGDFKPLAETARLFAGQMTDMADGFFLAVTCSEDVAFIRPEDVAPAVAGSFLGDFRVHQQQAACAGWPAAKIDPAFLTPVVSDVPSLLISGQLDPVTPASDGEEVARHLSHSRHVVVPGGGHGLNGMKGLECLTGLITQLIEKGSVDGLDTACVAKMERPPFQLRIEAARKP
jgi:pimeloyl-ACP methyl ester carboxylesterase